MPLYGQIPDNRGAKCERCVALPGKDRIGPVGGDREFVGHASFTWRKDNGRNIIVRLPKHHGLNHPAQPYAKRWTMAQGFQPLKGRGFNREATHLRCFQKLRKRVARVHLADAFWLGVGAAASPLPAKNVLLPGRQLEPPGPQPTPPTRPPADPAREPIGPLG